MNPFDELNPAGAEIDYKAEYLYFTEKVRRDTIKIMGSVMAGSKDRALSLAAALCSEAADRKNQTMMLGEADAGDAGRYDLAGLRVTPEIASNSETPFEDE